MSTQGSHEPGYGIFFFVTDTANLLLLNTYAENKLETKSMRSVTQFNPTVI